MSSRFAQHFVPVWEREARNTVRLLRALPPGRFDFRPDPAVRPLGELAWHLAELEAFMTYGLEMGKFEVGMRPPGLERPRDVEALAPGYERIHAEAVARVEKLSDEQISRALPFFGRTLTGEDILWNALLHHHLHHRGQVVLMCRLAGGAPPGMYGPSREEAEAMRPRG
jgi:uncharacterized damage-inducible protein DinB